MTAIDRTHEVLTPEQAAEYLQVNRETVYRYIRQGKLAASRLGRAYRVPRHSLELLLLATRVRDDIPLRSYSQEEIDRFIERDRMDDAARTVMERFTPPSER